MPAVARIRTVRSLSPSLLTHMTHRYLPYSRTAPPSSSTDLASVISSVSSRESLSCDRLNSLSISEKSASPEQRPRLPPISSITPPRRPVHAHRRAISMSSAPSGYIVFPNQAHQRPPPHFHPSPNATTAPMQMLLQRTMRPAHPSQPRPQQCRPVPIQHQHRPAQIRIASPPLTPVQESPKSNVGEKLMLVTPSVAAYLRQGGSVNIRGQDGKAWKVRVPIRSPGCGVIRMRM